MTDLISRYREEPWIAARDLPLHRDRRVLPRDR
jgi:hypothetical protein